MARARSKNYPAISLGQAIERARVLFKHEGRAAIPADVAVKAWGYNSLNGASLRVVSALRQYGLFDGSNEQVRLSPLALTLLLEPETHPEYSDALLQALSMPALFQDIMAEYGKETPSDAALISYLVRRQNFSEEAAKILIQAYRDSIELVKSKNAEYVNPVGASNALQAIDDNAHHKSLKRQEIAQTVAKQTTEYVFPLSEDTALTLTITGPLPSGEDVEALTDWLDLVKRQIIRMGRSVDAAEVASGGGEARGE